MAPTPAKKAPAKKVAAAAAKTAGQGRRTASRPRQGCHEVRGRQEAGREQGNEEGSRGEGAGPQGRPPEGAPAKATKAPAKARPRRPTAKSADGQEHRGQDGVRHRHGPARRSRRSRHRPSTPRSSTPSASLLIEERAKLVGQAERLEDEAAELMEDLDPGDVQFDDESGEGDSLVVERERDLALSAQARQTVSDIDAALRPHRGRARTASRWSPAGPSPRSACGPSRGRPSWSRRRSAGSAPAGEPARASPLAHARSAWAIAAHRRPARSAHQAWAVQPRSRRAHVDVVGRCGSTSRSTAAWPSARAGARVRSSASSRWWWSWCCWCRCGATGSMLSAVGIGLVIGGAVGNVARPAVPGRRRLPRGAVVDFIDLQWWPVFNVADMAIAVGGVILVVGSVLAGRTPASRRPSDERAARRAIPAALDGERVDRVVACSAGCSRSEAAALVAAGAVRIDGAVVVRRQAAGAGRARSLAVDVGELPEPVPPRARTRASRSTWSHEDADVIVVDKPRRASSCTRAPGRRTARSSTGCWPATRSWPRGRARTGPASSTASTGAPPGCWSWPARPAAYDALVAALGGPAGRAALPGPGVGRARGAPRPRRRADRALAPRPDAAWRSWPAAGRPGPATRCGPASTGRPTWPLLGCRLETGRTHQIRVHLAAIGHPVVGDRDYGGVRAAIAGAARCSSTPSTWPSTTPSPDSALSFDAPLPARPGRRPRRPRRPAS